MSAVTGYHRLPILAIAALVAAGCGANPSTSAPTAITTGEPTSGATSAIPTVPATTPSPTFGAEAPCEVLGLEITPDFAPGAIDANLGPMGHIALSTERAVSVADPSIVWPGGYDYGDSLPDVIRLRGGGEIEMNLELGYDF
jgi:hypothetical protein